MESTQQHPATSMFRITGGNITVDDVAKQIDHIFSFHKALYENEDLTPVERHSKLSSFLAQMDVLDDSPVAVALRGTDPDDQDGIEQLLYEHFGGPSPDWHHAGSNVDPASISPAGEPVENNSPEQGVTDPEEQKSVGLPAGGEVNLESLREIRWDENSAKFHVRRPLLEYLAIKTGFMLYNAAVYGSRRLWDQLHSIEELKQVNPTRFADITQKDMNANLKTLEDQTIAIEALETFTAEDLQKRMSLISGQAEAFSRGMDTLQDPKLLDGLSGSELEALKKNMEAMHESFTALNERISNALSESKAVESALDSKKLGEFSEKLKDVVESVGRAIESIFGKKGLEAGPA